MTIARVIPGFALALAATLALGGCTSLLFSDGPVTSSPSATPTPEPTRTGAPTPTAKPTPTPTATPDIGGWSECERIVKDLNAYAKAHPTPPTSYLQIEPSAFPLQDVGANALAKACNIKVTIDGEVTYWAVLPGDAALASTIKGNLIDAGFAPGGVAGILADPSSGQAASITSVANGKALDEYLVSTNAFSRLTIPLVYVGSFTLS